LKLLLGFLLLTTWVTVLLAQENSTVNPYNSPEDIAAGGRIFRSHCLGCHGRDGTGGRGPDLTRLDLRHSSTDQELANVIAEGIPATEMPGFFFNGRQLWQIVAFIRSLRQPSQQLRVKGNREAGAALFRGKGGCLQCHQANGVGGRLGPDLSQVGARRSPDHLKTSLLDPNQYVSPLDRRVHLVTRDGRHFSGARLNEDTYSVQLLDSKENLVSVLKRELKEYRLDSSSNMPSYRGVFSESELEDLVAYLYSFREKENRQ
jgi:putative heme-binding domain-containing protein